MVHRDTSKTQKKKPMKTKKKSGGVSPIRGGGPLQARAAAADGGVDPIRRGGPLPARAPAEGGGVNPIRGGGPLPD